MVKKVSQSILSRSNKELAIYEIIPEDREIKGVIQFHSGTVMKKEFYLKFAFFLAKHGYIIILFDYRGVGKSKSINLKESEASISSWGIEDAPAVTDWIQNKYPNSKIHLLAHSMGGQILGLMDNWSVFDKIIFLASSSGNWHNFLTSFRIKVTLSTSIFFPICLPIFGYVPGIFGLGQDWPKGVAKEWWETSRHNRLMAESMKLWHCDTQFDKVDKTIHAIFFDDDPMATTLTVPNIARSYPNANVITSTISPSHYGLNEIGHFGIFKSYNHDILGHLVTDALSS